MKPELRPYGKAKDINDGAPSRVSERLGDLSYASLQAFRCADVPSQIVGYVHITQKKREKRALNYARKHDLSKNERLARLARTQTPGHDVMDAFFDVVRAAVTRSFYDRAMDRLIDLGVPMQEYRENFDHMGIEWRKRCIDGNVGHLTHFAPSASPMHGFVKFFMSHIYAEAVLSKKAREQFISDPKTIRNFLSNKVNEFAWNYTHDRKPSQYAISYCRHYLDRHWKNRQYGESVTTLFLERFAKEIAHASTARYTHGLGVINGISAEQMYSSTVQSYLDEHQINHNGQLPVALSGAKREEFRNFMLAAFKMPSEETAWTVQNKTDGQGNPYKSRLLNAIPASFGTLFDTPLDAQAMLIGVIANLFLERASVDTDFVFIACLEAFILSETERCVSMKLHSNAHPAFRLSVDRIRANRKRDNLAKYSAFGGHEYLGFCWYQFVLRTMHCADKDAQQGSLQQPSLTLRYNRLYKIKRYLGWKRQVYQREHEYKIGATAPTITLALEYLVRDQIIKNDADAHMDAICHRIRGRFSSPTLRAVRLVSANSYAPMFSRRSANAVFKDSDLVLRIGDSHDWMDMISTTLSADAVTRILRKARADIMCGYSLIGHYSNDTGKQRELAMLAARRYLMIEIENLRMLNANYFEAYKARYSVVKTQIDTPSAARSILTYGMRATALYGDDFAIRQVEGISYARMMRMIDPLMRGNSRYPDKATARSASVFAAWQNMAVEYGANSQNHLLSYLMFASRYAVMSRIVSASALSGSTAPDRMSNRTIAFPMLCDKLGADLVYNYTLKASQGNVGKAVAQQDVLLTLPEAHGFLTEKQRKANLRIAGHNLSPEQCGLPSTALEVLSAVPDYLENRKKSGGREVRNGLYTSQRSVDMLHLVRKNPKVSINGSDAAPYRAEASNGISLQVCASGDFAILPTGVVFDKAIKGLRGQERLAYLKEHALFSGKVFTPVGQGKNCGVPEVATQCF